MPSVLGHAAVAEGKMQILMLRLEQYRLLGHVLQSIQVGCQKHGSSQMQLEGMLLNC